MICVAWAIVVGVIIAAYLLLLVLEILEPHFHDEDRDNTP
jgi:hypothetical protein